MSNDSNESPKKIVLWGGRSVGKTSLVATALYSEQVAEVDEASREKALPLERCWDCLRKGVPVGATSSEIEVTLRIRDGNSGSRRIVLQDIKGGDLDDYEVSGNYVENQKLLNSAAGVIFFVPHFDSPDFTGKLDAIVQYFAQLRESASADTSSQKSMCIVLTKSEQYMKADDLMNLKKADPPLDWWKAAAKTKGVSNRGMQLFEDCGEAVWPTSVFGFKYENGATSKPRVMLSEYGMLIPVTPLEPINVAEPFRWLFQELGNGSQA